MVKRGRKKTIEVEETNVDTSKEESPIEHEDFDTQLRKLISERDMDLNPQSYTVEKETEEEREEIVDIPNIFLKSRNNRIVTSVSRFTHPIKRINRKVSVNR